LHPTSVILGYKYNVQVLHYRGISGGQRVIAA